MPEQLMISDPPCAEPERRRGRWHTALLLAVLLGSVVAVFVLLIVVVIPSAGAAGGCGGGWRDVTEPKDGPWHVVWYIHTEQKTPARDWSGRLACGRWAVWRPAGLAYRHAGGHNCRVRRGDRAGAAGVHPSGPRAGLAAVRRLVGARRLHRVALHAAGGPRPRPAAPRQARAAAGRADPGDGVFGRRTFTGDDGVVLAAVLRVAVLPLPEAEPRHGGAGRVVAAGR